MNNGYAKFLEVKQQLSGEYGFDPVWMPDFLYDFQKSLVEWALRKGRAAIFADCGLGKSPLQLVWAENIVRKTNQNALILAPLAVSQQFVREGEKFGIDVGISRDGKPAGQITVINYERLHKADESDYAGVACDECFPPDMLIDVPSSLDSVLTTKYIQDIVQGDRILNASGVDYVKATHKRRINGAVRVLAGRCNFLCSENHPFFTMYGWRSAKDLQAGDYLMETATAMRLVRCGFPTEILGKQVESFLRAVLLREMANEYAGTQGEGAYSGSGCKTRFSEIAMVSQRCAEGDERNRADSLIESNERSKSAGKSFRINAWQSLQMSRWQRLRFNCASGSFVGDFAGGVDSGICHFAREEAGGLSHLLQSRFGFADSQFGHRTRWALSLEPQVSRQEERRQAGYVRVDSVEVLELGHSRLDRYRDAEGHVYFYDIEATRHPSFSVQGALVHNSSILKHWSGKTQKAVTRFLSKKRYRLLCTATPAPNDFVELGTASEALGYVSHSAMLETFFRQVSDNEKKQKANASDIVHSKRLSWRVIQSMGQWALKAHAFEPFWKWVSGWSRACRKPSDLGPYDDSRFVLPPLNRFDHMVTPRQPPPGFLFTIPAFGLNQERGERRRTIPERTELVAKLTDHGDAAIVWCQLNDEADAITAAIPDAVQVKGTQSIDKKEELLLAFLDGQARVLVTKAKIAGLGLNMQHCNHVVTFVDHSYEKFYQTVRRCWRFGQKRPVRLDVIATEGEINVKRNMERKEKLASQMFDSIIAYMNDAEHVSSSVPTMPMEVPQWMSSIT